MNFMSRLCRRAVYESWCFRSPNSSQKLVAIPTLKRIAGRRARMQALVKEADRWQRAYARVANDLANEKTRSRGLEIYVEELKGVPTEEGK